MRHRLVSFVCAVFVLTGPATAGDLTSGLNITGGENALARLKLERVQGAASDGVVLTLRVSVGQTRDVKGYGLSLAYDPGKYALVEARESDGNLLKAGTGQETLFLASDRTPGRLDIGAVMVDGDGVSGDGELVELVFQASDTPSASDFRISESVLIGVDGSIDPVVTRRDRRSEPVSGSIRAETEYAEPVQSVDSDRVSTCGGGPREFDNIQRARPGGARAGERASGSRLIYCDVGRDGCPGPAGSQWHLSVSSGGGGFHCGQTDAVGEIGAKARLHRQMKPCRRASSKPCERACRIAV